MHISASNIQYLATTERFAILLQTLRE